MFRACIVRLVAPFRATRLQRSSTKDAFYPAKGRGLDVTFTVLRWAVWEISLGLTGAWPSLLSLCPTADEDFWSPILLYSQSPNFRGFYGGLVIQLDVCQILAEATRLLGVNKCRCWQPPPTLAANSHWGNFVDSLHFQSTACTVECPRSIVLAPLHRNHTN